jgi:hypothetical protein
MLIIYYLASNEITNYFQWLCAKGGFAAILTPVRFFFGNVRYLS